MCLGERCGDALDGRSRCRSERPCDVLGDGLKLAVVGPSGAGKSTFAAACLRFLDLTAGSLELVGPDASSDIRSIPGDAVRRARDVHGAIDGLFLGLRDAAQ